MARDTLTRDPARPGFDNGVGRAGPTPPPDKRRGNGATIALLGVLLVGAVAWALVATFWDNNESSGPEAGITLSELTSDPEALFGSRVVVSGEIRDVVGQEDEAITADTGAATGFVLGAGSQAALVLGKQIPQLAALRADQDLAEGDVVQVTGTAREFDIAALEEQLGTDLADDEFSVFENRPVLLASAVNLVPTTARAQGEQLALTADELTDSPQEYLTQRITVRDLTVDEPDDILSPRAVALSQDIVVIGANGPTNLSPGFTGTVSGTLIEASSARLLNSVNLPQGATTADLFEEIGLDEQAFGEYDYALVANKFQAGG